MSTPVTLTAETLPEGICFQSEQERFNTFISFTSAEVPDEFTSFNVGTSSPAVDDQDKPWLKLNSDGSPDNTYTFAFGAWVATYWPPASSEIRMLWSGTEVALQTFDGGSVGAVTAITGPFWERDSAFDDLIPRGATATVPVNTNASELTSGASATDQVRGVYFIKRTARTHRVG